MYKDTINTQDAYAINQYNACCRYLDIPASFDVEGKTLLEKIVQLTEQLTIAREELNTAREDQAYMHKDLTIAIEQRDEYKAALQSADNHNHEIATKLEIVTEQRDRLADVLRMTPLDLHPADSQGLCLCSQCEFRFAAASALQSLTQNARAMTPATESDHGK